LLFFVVNASHVKTVSKITAVCFGRWGIKLYLLTQTPMYMTLTYLEHALQRSKICPSVKIYSL